MIRILLIPSSDYLGHPFPQRHNHLFERIHDGKEFEVHVIRFNIFEKPRLTSKCIIHEIPLELKIHSTPFYYLSNAVTYTNEILRIVKAESIDVIVAGNLLPPLLYCLAQRLTKQRIQFIFDLQDYYPTSAAGYITSMNGFLGATVKNLFEGITQYLIKKADLVTVPGIALAMYAQRTGAKNVEIIPNGISEHFLSKYDGNGVRKRLGFRSEDIVIGYIGSIEFWLDMEPLIKAVSEVNRKISGVKLLIIGKHLQTKYTQKVKNWIRKYEIEGIVLWLDFVPHENVPQYIASMDIGTIPFDITNSTAYYAAPNKLWEYLSQEIVVTATPIPEVLKYKNYVIPVEKSEDYINAIQNFRYYKKDLEIKRAEIKQLIQTRTWNRSAEKMRTVVKKIVKSQTT